MVTGASVQCSKDALRLTRLYPGILYSSAGKNIEQISHLIYITYSVILQLKGIHPHDAKTWTDEDPNCYEVIKELARYKYQFLFKS